MSSTAARVDQLEMLLGVRAANGAARDSHGSATPGSSRRDGCSSASLVGDPYQRGAASGGPRLRHMAPRIGLSSHVAAVNDVRLHVRPAPPRANGSLSGYSHANVSKVSTYPTAWSSRRAACRDRGRADRQVRRRITAILDELTGRFDAVLYFCAPGPLRQLTSSPGPVGGRSSAYASCPARPRALDETPTIARDGPCSLVGRWRRLRMAARVQPGRSPLHSTCGGEADGERGFTLACASRGSVRCRWTAAWGCSPRAAVPASTGLRRHGLGQDRDTAAVRVGRREGERRASVLSGREGRPGDRRTVRGLMADAGRTTRVFPNEPFDAWRGRRTRSTAG